MGSPEHKNYPSPAGPRPFARTRRPATRTSSRKTSTLPCGKPSAGVARVRVSNRAFPDTLGDGSPGTSMKRGTSMAPPEHTRAIGSKKRSIHPTQNIDWIGAAARDSFSHGVAGSAGRAGHGSCPHLVPLGDRSRRTVGDGSGSRAIGELARRSVRFRFSAVPVDRGELVVPAARTLSIPRPLRLPRPRQNATGSAMGAAPQLAGAREGNSLPDLTLHRDEGQVVARWMPDGTAPAHPALRFTGEGETRMAVAAAERGLAGAVEAVMERLAGSEEPEVRNFRADWAAVTGATEQERRLCESAGKLGIDPFDPDELTEDLEDALSKIVANLDAPVRTPAPSLRSPRRRGWARKGGSSGRQADQDGLPPVRGRWHQSSNQRG